MVECNIAKFPDPKSDYDMSFPTHKLLKITVRSREAHIIILYLINIHWLSVDFDWSRAGHAQGAIDNSVMSHDHITL